LDSEQIRQPLATMRRELEQRHERIAKHTRHRDEPLPSDFAEQATELENGETLVALDREAEEEMARIDLALRRLDDGTYGSCASCAEPINQKRLEAIPHASLCIDCASEA
jgi:RNA polymerase-binding protein DksA